MDAIIKFKECTYSLEPEEEDDFSNFTPPEDQNDPFYNIPDEAIIQQPTAQHSEVAENTTNIKGVVAKKSKKSKVDIVSDDIPQVQSDQHPDEQKNISDSLIKFAEAPENPIYKAICDRTIHVPENEKMSTIKFTDWIKNHPEIFKDGVFYTTDKQVKKDEAKLVIIFAGVGAGKTYFVINELSKYGSVYYNSSRKAIKEQQINKLKSKPNVQIELSWDLHNSKLYNAAKNSKYLVIDESHHIFSDSYCDAPNYVFDLLLKRKEDQTIILLTACVDYFTSAMESINYNINYLHRANEESNNRSVHLPSIDIGKWFSDSNTPYDKDEKLPFFSYPLCVVDVMNACRNLHPRKVHIVNDLIAREKLNESDDTSKYIYYCNSAKKAYRMACEYILKGKRAIAITSSSKYLEPIIEKTISNAVKKELKKVRESSEKWLEKYKDLFLNVYDLPKAEQKAIADLENEKFPTNIDIIFTTSKMREGINIPVKSIENYKEKTISVFSESIDKVNLVQTVGRIRNKKRNDINIDYLYVVVGVTNNFKNNYYTDFLTDESKKKNKAQSNGQDEHDDEDFSTKQVTLSMLTGVFKNEIKQCNAYDYEKIASMNSNNPNFNYDDAEYTLSHKKQLFNVNKVQNRLNKIYGSAGKVYPKPYRNEKNGYIEEYSIEHNPLWRINKMALTATSLYADSKSKMQLEELKVKLSDLFPKSIVSLDITDFVERKEYEREEVIKTIEGFIGKKEEKDIVYDYIGKKDARIKKTIDESNVFLYSDLEEKLKELNFITDKSRVWHQISTLGEFIVTQGNSKRERYTIKRIKRDKVIGVFEKYLNESLNHKQTEKLRKELISTEIITSEDKITNSLATPFGYKIAKKGSGVKVTISKSGYK
jgi:hypothetical protein